MDLHSAESLAHRLQEAEIRLAFLDKELEDYKDAVQSLHHRLQNLEKVVEALKQTPRDLDSHHE